MHMLNAGWDSLRKLVVLVGVVLELQEQ